MTELIFDKTRYTPEVTLNPNGNISFVGKSYPENTFEFYEPIRNWIEEYFDNPQKTTNINFHIIYFNSSSSKFFFDLFDIFELSSSKSDIIINWIYDKENESAIEAGEDFIEDFEDLNINLKEV